MEVQLTEDQEQLVRRAVKSGRYGNEGAVVQDAMSLWVERERRREEIVAAIEVADPSYSRGEGRWITSSEEMTQFSDEVKQRGRARLAALKPVI